MEGNNNQNNDNQNGQNNNQANQQNNPAAPPVPVTNIFINGVNVGIITSVTKLAPDKSKELKNNY